MCDSRIVNGSLESGKGRSGMIETCVYNSPLGRLLLAAQDGALVGLWLEGQKYFGGTYAAEARQTGGQEPILEQAQVWLDRYFAGEKPLIATLKLSPAGSLFRQTVWSILTEIPYGELITYGDIARQAAHRLGLSSMSAQAVGGAVGHNPISIIIPCHRVVGAKGSLTGYAGGIANKLKLLEHEGVQTSALFVPKKSTAP